MKYPFKLAALVCVLFSSQTIAADCAQLALGNIDSSEGEKIAELIGANGAEVSDKVRFLPPYASAVLKGEYFYDFEAGKHTLLFNKMKSRTFSELSKARIKLKTQKDVRIDEHLLPTQYFLETAIVSLQAGKKYVLESKEDEKGILNYQLAEVGEASCENEQPIASAEKARLSVEPLPEELEYRLSRLIAKIQKANHDQPESFFTPVSIYQYFGAIVHEESDETHIKVVDVLPNSLADNLGLKKGDAIVSFGRRMKAKNKTHHFDRLNNYLQSLDYGDPVIMNVRRGRHLLTLNGSNNIQILPQTVLQYAQNPSRNHVNQYTAIAPLQTNQKLAIEYSQLILEISHYYQQKGVNEDIVLARPKMQLPIFGLKGSSYSQGEVQGLIATQIEPNSSAEKIGLKVGDVVIRVNGKAFEQTLSLNEWFSSIRLNEKVTLTVLRQEETYYLAGSYKPMTVRGFSLDIAMSDISKSDTETINRRINQSQHRFLAGGDGSRYYGQEDALYQIKESRGFNRQINYNAGKNSTGKASAPSSPTTSTAKPSKSNN